MAVFRVGGEYQGENYPITLPYLNLNRLIITGMLSLLLTALASPVKAQDNRPPEPVPQTAPVPEVETLPNSGDFSPEPTALRFINTVINTINNINKSQNATSLKLASFNDKSLVIFVPSQNAIFFVAQEQNRDLNNQYVAGYQIRLNSQEEVIDFKKLSIQIDRDSSNIITQIKFLDSIKGNNKLKKIIATMPLNPPAEPSNGSLPPPSGTNPGTNENGSRGKALYAPTQQGGGNQPPEITPSDKYKPEAQQTVATIIALAPKNNHQQATSTPEFSPVPKPAPEPTPPPATETPTPEATPETLPAEGEILARFVNPATVPEIPTGDPNRVTFGYELVLDDSPLPLRLNEYWDISKSNFTLKKVITPEALQKMEIGGAEYTRGQESEDLIRDHADYILYYYLQHQAAFNAVAAKYFAGYPDLTQYHSLAELQANPKWQAWEASLVSTDPKVNPLAGMTERIALKIEEQFIASITDANGDFDWDKFHAWQNALQTNPEGQSVVLFSTYEAPDGSYKQGFVEFNWAKQRQITTIITDNAALNPGTHYLQEPKYGTVFTQDGIVLFWSNYYGCAHDTLERMQKATATEEDRADEILSDVFVNAELSLLEDNPYSRFFLANYKQSNTGVYKQAEAFYLLRDFLGYNLTNANDLDFNRKKIENKYPSLWIPVNSPEDIRKENFIPLKFTPSSNK